VTLFLIQKPILIYETLSTSAVASGLEHNFYNSKGVSYIKEVQDGFDCSEFALVAPYNFEKYSGSNCDFQEIVPSVHTYYYFSSTDQLAI
jgi:hypothetical protein